MSKSEQQPLPLHPEFRLTRQIAVAKLDQLRGFDLLYQMEGERYANGERQKWRYWFIERHYDGTVYRLPDYGHVRIALSNPKNGLEPFSRNERHRR